MNSPRTRLYKDKQNAKLMGVCAGIADYTGIDVNIIRWAVFVSLFIPALNGIVLPSYFIAGIVLDQKPTAFYSDSVETRYWQGVRQNPQRTAREIRSRMKDVDRRLAEVENYYVSSNPRLNAEIERLR